MFASSTRGVFQSTLCRNVFIGYNISMLRDIVKESKEKEWAIERETFHDEELTGINLSRLEFTKIHFRSCKFSDCDFTKANFLNCGFEECDFSNCNFTDGYFKKIKFTNCKGTGADFSKGVFKDSVISDSLFDYANFSQ